MMDQEMPTTNMVWLAPSPLRYPLLDATSGASFMGYAV